MEQLTQAVHAPMQQRVRKTAEKVSADRSGNNNTSSDDSGIARTGSPCREMVVAKHIPSPKLSMANSYYAGSLIWISMTSFVVGLVAVVGSQFENAVQSVFKYNDVTQHSACTTVLPILGSMAVLNVGLAFPAMGWQFSMLYQPVTPSSTTVLRLKFLYWCETMFLIQYIGGVVGLVSFIFYGIRLKMEFDGFYSTWGRLAWAVNAVLVLLVAYQWVVFDRFRTHQKQQLGAPNELEHVGSWKFRRWISGLLGKKAKTTSEFRANLYASVKRGADAMLSSRQVIQVQALLANALEGLTTENFLDKMGGVDMGIGSVYQWLWRRHNRGKYALVSPLHVAVSHGHVECIHALRQYQANLDIVATTDIFSKELAVPPLFYADSRDTMNVLLEYGANHLMVPSFGTAMTTTVLQHNLFLDRVGLARLLEDHGCDYALTPLHALAAAGDVATVQHYMKNGVDPDMLGEYYVGLNQRTPLHWAAVMGRTRVVEALLLHRATVDFTDRMGRTPLHWAARHNQVGAINALLSNHANPICLDDSNMTPLDVGSHSGTLREPAIRSLVSCGSLNINGAYCGDTPLHLALKQGHKEAALALIACGADIYQTNRDGRRAIDCCISAELQYSIKKASGSVDVYVSYDPPYYAFAKAVCDSVETNFISVNLRPVLETVYLYTRQIIPFQRSVVVHKSTPTTDPTSHRVQLYAIEMNQDVFTQAMRSLLDGLRDEVELHRLGKRQVLDHILIKHRWG
ncbi:hypothetical protein B5M09_001513 [Aphanomyces astaci]|uniref:Uncharacterized protein n=1 Tax=Aphanomyces astaci TaxID=112090 RepID=A0A3R7Z822_APHAT|nr:hypothetical protein B5M09_001513 [Aphanomyces astaci]